MTEEELRENLDELLHAFHFAITNHVISLKGSEIQNGTIDKIIAIVKEAGWKPPAPACEHSWAYYVPDGYKCTKCGEEKDD